MEEISEILQYKRSLDVWVCPECDCENDLISRKCKLCSYPKPANPVILRPFSEVEYDFTNDEKESDFGYNDREIDSPSDTGNSKAAPITIIIIILIVLIIAFFAAY